MRRQTPWMKAVRDGLDLVMNSLGQMDKQALAKAGIYKEKLTIYKKRGNLPNSVNLVACLLLLRIPLKVSDPETGDTWVLHFSIEEGQLVLPFSKI